MPRAALQADAAPPWRRVKQTSEDALDNSVVPFTHVAEKASHDRDSSYSPVFQVMFTLAERAAFATRTLGQVRGRTACLLALARGSLIDGAGVHLRQLTGCRDAPSPAHPGQWCTCRSPCCHMRSVHMDVMYCHAMQGVDAKFDLTLELLEDGQGGLLGGLAAHSELSLSCNFRQRLSALLWCRPAGVLHGPV